MALAILLGVASAAQATPGDDAGSGDVTVTVQNVWTWDVVSMNPAYPPVWYDREVDCPTGMKVVAGYGVQVYPNSGGAVLVPGEALDEDTWKASFYNNLGQYYNFYLQVHATCA